MILTSLREETRPLHDRVEQALDLAVRLSSVEAYTGLLVRMLGFYTPFEASLATITGYETIPLNFSSRRKAPWLRRDLLALGRSADSLNALPVCKNLPSVDTLADALGCLYVLEGATLGGQIIRKEVQRRHGLETDSGCAFFSSYQAQVGDKWKEFCSGITGYASRNPGTEDAIVAAAMATFGSLDEWIRETT